MRKRGSVKLNLLNKADSSPLAKRAPQIHFNTETPQSSESCFVPHLGISYLLARLIIPPSTGVGERRYHGWKTEIELLSLSWTREEAIKRTRWKGNYIRSLLWLIHQLLTRSHTHQGVLLRQSWCNHWWHTGRGQFCSDVNFLSQHVLLLLPFWFDGLTVVTVLKWQNQQDSLDVCLIACMCKLRREGVSMAINQPIAVQLRSRVCWGSLGQAVFLNKARHFTDRERAN